MNELFLSFPFLKHISFAEVKQSLEMVWRSVSQDLRDDVKPNLATLMRSRNAPRRGILLQLVIDLLETEIGEDDESGRNALQSFDEMSNLNDQIATIKAAISENSEHPVLNEIEQGSQGASVSDLSPPTVDGGGMGPNETVGLGQQVATQGGGGSLEYSRGTDSTVFKELKTESEEVEAQEVPIDYELQNTVRELLTMLNDDEMRDMLLEAVTKFSTRSAVRLIVDYLDQVQVNEDLQARRQRHLEPFRGVGSVSDTARYEMFLKEVSDALKESNTYNTLADSEARSTEETEELNET